MHQLSPLGVLTFARPTPLRLADAAVGTRAIVEFADVTFEGDRLNGRQKGPAGDWLLISPQGVASLDIRFTLETPDGALIHVEGQGRTDAAKFASQGGPMTFAPRFETGDPRYRWLNLVQAVATGWAKDGKARFTVSAVEAGPPQP